MRWWKVRRLRKQFVSARWNDSFKRKEAAIELGKLKDQGAVDLLIAALKPSMGHWLPEAARALGQIGDRRAVDPLIRQLKESNPEEMQAAIVEALVEMGDPRSIEPLVNELCRLPRFVPGALMKFGRAAIPALLSGLVADTPVKRKAALQMLQQMAWQPETNAERVRIAIVTENWDGVKNDQAVAYLLARLTDPDPHSRWEAADVLKRIGFKPQDVEQSARFYAATGNWGKARTLGEDAIKPLLEFIEWMSDQQIELGNTLQALGWIPTDERQKLWLLIATRNYFEAADLGPIAIDPLVRLVARLKNTNERSQLVAVAQSLGRFNEKKAVDALASLAEQVPIGEYDDAVFSAAVKALKQIGGGLAASALWRTLQKCAHTQTIEVMEHILTETPSSIASEDLISIARTEWLTGKYVQKTGPIPYGDPDCTGIVANRRVQVPTLSQLAKAELARRT